MKTRAVRIHGTGDLRLEEFELPEIRDDEILVKVVSDSICMSTYKLAKAGNNHKRVRGDLAQDPAIVGHEFAGDIVQVGAAYADQYRPGQKFTIQPALNNGTMWTPGYSYGTCGGDCTYCILPAELMECGCLLAYDGDAYYPASLAEPMSCNVGAFHACYHTKPGVYEHEMGTRPGGALALVAAAGPMGLGGLTYALHRTEGKPRTVVLVDINQERLDRAASLFPPERICEEEGIDLRFVNSGELADPVAEIRAITGGAGFDDVFCYAPVAPVVRLSADLLGRDGCLNFFAGPVDAAFSAPINFYDVHYNATHVIGTTGGNTADMVESLELMASGRIDPAVMVTHIGGLPAVVETTLNLPQIPGGKKLIYTHTDLPLIALGELRAHAAETGDARFAELAGIVDGAGGLWCAEAERYLLREWARD